MADQVDIPAHIIEAGATALGRLGRAGFSLSAVADAAGCSRVTLYRNGIELDVLLAAIVGRAASDLRTALWPVFTDPHDAATRLATALRTLCTVVETHRRVLTAVFDAPTPPSARRARTVAFDFTEPFERLLRDGLVDGSLVTDDPVTDAELIVNAVTWTYVHLRQAHGWVAAGAADRVVAMATAFVTPTE